MELFNNSIGWIIGAILALAIIGFGSWMASLFAAMFTSHDD